MVYILYCIIFSIIAYLIGSIPTGYLIVKIKTDEDIRTIGSGSTGATNVKRVLGKNWFFIVMFIDAIKGAIPVMLAKSACNLHLFNDEIGLIAVLSAIFVIIGHSKPVFLQFRGGKSVASGVGTILALNIIVGLSIALVWAIVTYSSKYVSVGSITALLLSPILMYLLNSPICYTAYCAIAALYIIYLHRENIKRLFLGKENKVR